VGPAGRSRSLWFLKSIPILSPIRRHSALYLKEQEMRRGFPRISCGVWWRWRTSLAFLTESRTRHVRCSVQEIRSPIVNPCTPKSRTWAPVQRARLAGKLGIGCTMIRGNSAGGTKSTPVFSRFFPSAPRRPQAIAFMLPCPPEDELARDALPPYEGWLCRTWLE
jgi:hypothetical protein